MCRRVRLFAAHGAQGRWALCFSTPLAGRSIRRRPGSAPGHLRFAGRSPARSLAMSQDASGRGTGLKVISKMNTKFPLYLGSLGSRREAEKAFKIKCSSKIIPKLLRILFRRYGSVLTTPEFKSSTFTISGNFPGTVQKLLLY